MKNLPSYEDLCRQYKVPFALYTSAIEMKRALAAKMLPVLEPEFAKGLIPQLPEYSESALDAIISRLDRGKENKRRAPKQKREPWKQAELYKAMTETKGSRPWLNSDEKAAQHLYQTDLKWRKRYGSAESMANAFFQVKRNVRDLQEAKGRLPLARARLRPGGLIIKRVTESIYLTDPAATQIWSDFYACGLSLQKAEQEGKDTGAILSALDEIFNRDHPFAQELALLFAPIDKVYMALPGAVEKLNDDARTAALLVWLKDRKFFKSRS